MGSIASSAYDDNEQYINQCKLLGVQPVSTSTGWLDTDGIHAKAVSKIANRYWELLRVAESYKARAVERLKLGYMDGEI